MTDATFVDKTLVAPIQLDDAHGTWQFLPQPDITAYELALIDELFVAMLVRKSRLDWREFLTRERGVRVGSNGHDVVAITDLSRHFKEL